MILQCKLAGGIKAPCRVLARSNRKNQICRHYVPDIFGILLGFVKKTQAFFQLHHARLTPDTAVLVGSSYPRLVTGSERSLRECSERVAVVERGNLYETTV